MLNARTTTSHALSITAALFVLLSACTPSAAPPPPTRTPPPTFTPTPVVEAPTPDPVAAAPTQAVEAPPADQGQAPQDQSQEEAPVEGDQPAAPAETPTTAPTPTPQVAEVVINSPINIRQGPGTNYNIIGGADQGQRFPVTGKNQAGDWWQINYQGQAGWVFGQLVTPQNTGGVQVAQNIPAPPPPPPPTNTPAPQPPPAEPPPAEPQPEEPQPEDPGPQDQGLPFVLLNTERCDPNAANTYFQGFVRYRDNSPRNGVCVHIHFYEPRATKCSGCDGVGDGIWGFEPFGGPAPPGTTVEIFVVSCPGQLPPGGQSQASGFGDLTPRSPKWTRTIQESEQCTGITFVGD